MKRKQNGKWPGQDRKGMKNKGDERKRTRNRMGIGQDRKMKGKQ